MRRKVDLWQARVASMVVVEEQLDQSEFPKLFGKALEDVVYRD